MVINIYRFQKTQIVHHVHFVQYVCTGAIYTTPTSIVTADLEDVWTRQSRH